MQCDMIQMVRDSFFTGNDKGEIGRNIVIHYIETRAMPVSCRS